MFGPSQALLCRTLSNLVSPPPPQVLFITYLTVLLLKMNLTGESLDEEHAGMILAFSNLSLLLLPLIMEIFGFALIKRRHIIHQFNTLEWGSILEYPFTDTRRIVRRDDGSRFIQDEESVPWHRRCVLRLHCSRCVPCCPRARVGAPSIVVHDKRLPASVIGARPPVLVPRQPSMLACVLCVV